ncbi:MAG: DUF1648 domain-containing protein [Chloroflexi bacterium]|nr:DUF1648 domain-containing protein [Chloroflexota bacterium]
MTLWQTKKNLGLGGGIGLMIAILLIDANLIWLATNRPLVIGTFIVGLTVLFSLGLLGMIVYWLYGLVRSGYSLDRNMLVIHWGATEQIIPTGQIERVLTGDEVEGNIPFYGAIWPGHCVGQGEVPDAGPTLFFATVPPKHQIYVVTPKITFGISPADHDSFLESLRKRMEMGSTQVVEPFTRRPDFLSWQIWQDRIGLILLATSLLLLLALTSLLCFQFPALPRLVPLHFDVVGQPDRLEARGQIFVIPLIGFVALLLNSVLGGLAYRRERMVSYMLWGGTILIQVLMWTAAIGILGRL